MRTFLYAMLLAAVVATVGCADKGVSVAVTSDDRDALEGPGDRPGASMSGAERISQSSRPPFIGLSRYDWEYVDWLNDLTHAVARVRLPDSKTAQFVLRYDLAGRKPSITIECGDLRPPDCEVMREQAGRLKGLPELPASYPYGVLVVRLTRLPR